MKHTHPLLQVAMASAIELPDSDAPEWVHLLPSAGGKIMTVDGRGPYQVEDANEVISKSLAAEYGMLIDVNHATDILGPKGGDAPARGWIKDLKIRADGIWGRVEWSPAGKALMAERAYRFLSPVITHDEAGKIFQVLRASLTNRPNLRGLASLNMESVMDMTKIAEALGLGADATMDAIIAAIVAMKSKKADMPAMQTAMAEIGVALGIEGSDPAAILAAARAAKGGTAVITALQTEVSQLTTSLNAITAATSLAAATAFVDTAIKAGRVSVKPLRDHYIAMHQENPTRVEKEIGGMPILGASGITAQPPVAGAEITSLNAEQSAVAEQLGISPEKFLVALKADTAKKDAH